jgi:hypothetical protein
MSASYSVTSPSPTCAVTGAAIEPGAPCMSLLYEIDGDILVRQDVCMRAWERGERPAAPSRDDGPVPLVAYWRTTMRDRDEPKKMLIGDGEVLDLFEQLEDAEGDHQLAFRYLLCLILIRKKQLIWEGARPATRDEVGAVLVRRRGDKEGPVIEVIDPGLDDASIEAATKQLSAVMNLDA